MLGLRASTPRYLVGRQNIRFTPHRWRTRTGVEILSQQVVVVLTDGVEQRLIDTAIAKSAGGDLVEDPSQSGALLLDGNRAVHVLVAQVLHSRGQVAEED